MPKPASRPVPRRGPLQQRAEITTGSRAFPRMKAESVPRTGWVREIRMALGLSQSQLAARAGVSRATVQQMERAEAQRRITLASLDKLAHAMGCQVALAIVPKGGTLEDVRRQQAAAKADVILQEKIPRQQAAAAAGRPRAAQAAAHHAAAARQPAQVVEAGVEQVTGRTYRTYASRISR